MWNMMPEMIPCIVIQLGGVEFGYLGLDPSNVKATKIKQH